MDDSSTRGELDRCRPVVRSKAITVGEPAHVAGIADELRGDDRTDSIDLGQRGPRRLDGEADPAV